METMRSTQPPVLLSETEYKVKSGGYGYRKSVHKGWIQHYYHQHLKPEGWSVDAETFLQKVGDCDSNNRVRVCAVNPKGGTEVERFFKPTKDMAIADILHDWATGSACNIMFDPVPWIRGKRLKRTRLGFRTIVGEHPFDYLPSPTVFWAIGVSAYQFLAPMPHLMKVRDMIEFMDNAGLSGAQRLHQPSDELLYVPGSLIHRPGLPPYTAEVLFDAFSEVDVVGGDWLWTQY